jgi:uncharacterized protein Veg
MDVNTPGFSFAFARKRKKKKVTILQEGYPTFYIGEYKNHVQLPSLTQQWQ